SVGFLREEIVVGTRTVIDMQMSPDIQTLKELVVIGYGAQSRETITTSVSKMDNKVLENIPYANTASALQGALSGVRVQILSGQPGAEPRIIVRGGTSINNPNGAKPLYVVDGVVRSQMNNIVADDIESVQVLKDAASSAIYGARGSNGVVVITTKSGKPDQITTNYSYDLSISKPTKLYDLASARDYLTFARKAMIVRDIYPDASFRLTGPSGFGTGNDLTNNTAYTTQYLTPENEHKLAEGWESMPDPVDPSKTIIFKGTDWQDVLFRTAVSQNHYLSVQGGKKNAVFGASLGYLDNQGIALNSGKKRYSLNLNGNLKVNERLNVFSRTNFSKDEQNGVGSDVHVFARAITLPPTAKYRFEDGTLAPGQSWSEANPEYRVTTTEVESSNEELTLLLGANWELLPDLIFEPQISVYNIVNDRQTFQPSYLNGPGKLVTRRDAVFSVSKWLQRQYDGVFSYKKSFSSHNLDAKAGFSYYGRKNSRFYASGRDASSDLIPTLNASATPRKVSSTVSDQVIFGYFGRVNYNYDYRYLLSLNIRYDGASNLGANYKWGTFPGISLGWNLHHEKFWENITEDLLKVKIRGSYGVNGNVSGLGDFTAQGSYSVGKIYSGLSGVQNTVIPNTELKWERSKTLNFGTDIGMFGSRIKILFDVYRRVTDNLITTFALPPSTGFSSVLTNLGSLENKGMDLELSFRILKPTSEFQWDFAFNASYVKNKILKLPPNGTEHNRIGGYYVWDPSVNDYRWLGGLQEGGTLGNYYEYKNIGVYATDEDAKNAPYDNIARVKDVKFGGDVIWADIDGNGEIDSRDKVYVGNEHPDWTGGITNTLTYKNLALSIRMDYTLGHTIYNFTRAFMNGQWKLNMNLTQEMVEHAWQNQGDVTHLPRYDWESTRAQYNIYPARTGQQYYESGDFLAIREVTLSYDLPRPVLSFAKISRARLNVTGNNLHYFTKFKGLNPEYGGQDYGRYPVPRNLILGLNITF
ncbi:MAG: SusC/RagA family TonB-linked outer membrane protein, partial [Cytophagales bacterium]|nr:SusC/RagA family TonB-linked outer membrane protein [Cytophagales bacterium]